MNEIFTNLYTTWNFTIYFVLKNLFNGLSTILYINSIKHIKKQWNQFTT